VALSRPRLAVFRALLSAHFQASWNSSAREMGKQGTLVLALLVGLLGLLGAGPLFLGMGGLGWLMGQGLGQPHIPVLLGGCLSLLSLGGGLFGGVAGGTRQLSWEAYRGYPLKLRTLYFAELVAGVADPLPLILGVGLLGFCSGLALGSPSAIPLLPLLFLETLLTVLAFQLLVGGLAAALVKRLRLALTLLAILAWVGSTLATGPLPPRARDAASQSLRATRRAQRGERLEVLARRGAQILAFLPGHASAQGLVKAREGRWGTALLLQTYPLGFLALLMVLGSRLLARESKGESTVQATRGPDRLWTFSGPAEGIGRLHFRTLMASQLGKFAFLMPVMTLVLLKGPFAQLRGQSLWAVPAAFAYLSLVGNNFVLNQFGLDRHGIKALLLLPLSASDLLRGKLLGNALHQGLQALLLVLLLAAFDGAGPGPLLAGVLMLGCVFLAQGAVGQWTSAWAPRPMPLDSMKNSSMPLAVVLLSLFTSGLWTSLFGGTYALAAWLAPAWLVPVMALAFLVTLALHLALLPTAAAYLDRRREILAERLG